jgi:hypothetical protein
MFHCILWKYLRAVVHWLHCNQSSWLKLATRCKFHHNSFVLWMSLGHQLIGTLSTSQLSWFQPILSNQLTLLIGSFLWLIAKKLLFCCLNIQPKFLRTVQVPFCTCLLCHIQQLLTMIPIFLPSEVHSHIYWAQFNLNSSISSFNLMLDNRLYFMRPISPHLVNVFTLRY